MAIRSALTDDGMTVTLDLQAPYLLTMGSIRLHTRSGCTGLAADTFLGCPGGDVTWPSHHTVVAEPTLGGALRHEPQQQAVPTVLSRFSVVPCQAADLCQP